MSFYRHHVFFCTNQRDNGRQCCNDINAIRLLDYAKQRVRELKLNRPGEIRISASGCMDRCARGPVIAIYPEAVWYTYANERDVEEIITEHLVNGRPVERLRVPDVLTAP
jgi:(2Fe-2S) ferredoxin